MRNLSRVLENLIVKVPFYIDTNTNYSTTCAVCYCVCVVCCVVFCVCVVVCVCVCVCCVVFCVCVVVCVCVCVCMCVGGGGRGGEKQKVKKQCTQGLPFRVIASIAQ